MVKKLQVKDRLLIAFLVALGVGALFFEVSRLGNIINGNLGKNDNAVDLADDKNIDTILDLQKKDTDNDGLSDYDEINVYGTSIYIPDSDSDGYSDKQEVDTGNNPNCPVGQDCSFPEYDLVDQEELKKTDMFDEYSDVLSAVVSSVSNGSPVTTGEYGDVEQDILSGQASIDDVKKMLVSAGMSEDDLSKIPDGEIMKIYLELVGDEK